MKSNCRTILVNSAQTAGHEVISDTANDIVMVIKDGWPCRWNPIDCSETAFQLMADACLTVEITDNDCEAWKIVGDRRIWQSEPFGNHHGNKFAATRMAIVRLAAELQEVE